MPDLKQLLERTHAHAPAPAFDLETLRNRRDRRRRTERLGAGALGIALTAAFVTGIVIVGSSDSEPAPRGTIPPAATPVPALGPGEYSYVRSREIFGHVVFGPIAKDYQEWTEEAWIDRNGAGRSTSTSGGSTSNVTWPSSEDGPNWAALLPTDRGALSAYLLDPDEMSASPVPENPSTPDQSPASVRVTGVAAVVLGPGADVLASPQQRVAFLDLLATYAGDGVSLDPDTTDPAGRDAYSLSFRTDAGPTEYVFFVDPQTHDLLATSALLPQSGQLSMARIVEVAAVTETVGVSVDATWLPAAGDRLDLPLEVSDEYAKLVERRRQRVFG